MGYYTSYGLDYKADSGFENEEEEFEKALIDITKYADGNEDCEIKELLQTGGVWAKLYDIVSVIDDLAPKFPHLLICLSGDGEDSDDNWEQRWKGEEKEYQVMTMPPFQNKNLWADYEKKHNN